MIKTCDHYFKGNISSAKTERFVPEHARVLKTLDRVFITNFQHTQSDTVSIHSK